MGSSIKQDLQRFNAAIDGWMSCADVNDEDLYDQYLQDEKDLKAVRDAVISGDFRQARKLAYSLDMIMFDQIPSRLLNKIYNRAANAV